jgi:hypothetical protein
VIGLAGELVAPTSLSGALANRNPWLDLIVGDLLQVHVQVAERDEAGPIINDLGRE